MLCNFLFIRATSPTSYDGHSSSCPLRGRLAGIGLSGQTTGWEIDVNRVADNPGGSRK